MKKPWSAVRVDMVPNNDSGFEDFNVYWKHNGLSDKHFDEHSFVIRKHLDSLILCEWDNDSNRVRKVYEDPKILAVYQRNPYAQSRLVREAGKYACHLIQQTGWKLQTENGLLGLEETTEFFDSLAKDFLRK